MATTYKVLGQAAPADTAEAALYTCGSASGAVVSTLTITNVTTSTAVATVNICVANAASATKNTLLKTVNIPPLSMSSFTLGISLANTDVIKITSGTGNALAFQAYGIELS